MSYLLGLSRLSEDKGEETQADFLMLGRAFAYLECEEGKNCHSQEESSQAQFLPENLGLLKGEYSAKESHQLLNLMISFF